MVKAPGARHCLSLVRRAFQSRTVSLERKSWKIMGREQQVDRLEDTGEGLSLENRGQAFHSRSRIEEVNVETY